ncbi:MAG: flagellar type III secretion system protein FliR [Rhizobiaceae bacterium]|nr:flagellar type III secretion system protein FliR [Rhizobiaceae bacterium]
MFETPVITAFLAFCRIGGCFMLMPGLSSVRVPVNVRLFVSVAASLALVGTVWDQIVPHVSSRPSVLIPLVVSELVTGALIGLVARFFMLSLSFMASAIAMMGGYGGVPGSSIEENDVNGPAGAIITLGALIVLFVLDFHHQVVLALVKSYEVAPVNLFFSSGSALADLSDTLSDSFLLVLRLGSPFIAYALLVNLATGLINKLSPAIPVYFISMPFVLAGALVLMYFSYPTVVSLFGDAFSELTVAR